MRNKVTRDIRVILNAPDNTTAIDSLRLTIAKVETSAPRLAKWMETAIPEALTVTQLPSEIKTSNGLERVIQEISRQFKTIGLFVNEASCLRLASAIRM